MNGDRITEIVKQAYEVMENQEPIALELKPCEIAALLSFTEGVYPVALDHWVVPLRRALEAALSASSSNPLPTPSEDENAR